MPENIGFMERGHQTLFFNDWVIPDFVNSTDSRSKYCYISGPSFAIHDKEFFIFGWIRADSPNTLSIGLREKSEDYAEITINNLSFSLVSNDGSELDIVLVENLTLQIHSKRIATIEKSSLNTNFLPNGELRIRC